MCIEALVVWIVGLLAILIATTPIWRTGDAHFSHGRVQTAFPLPFNINDLFVQHYEMGQDISLWRPRSNCGRHWRKPSNRRRRSAPSSNFPELKVELPWQPAFSSARATAIQKVAWRVGPVSPDPCREIPFSLLTAGYAGNSLLDAGPEFPCSRSVGWSDGMVWSAVCGTAAVTSFTSITGSLRGSR